MTYFGHAYSRHAAFCRPRFHAPAPIFWQPRCFLKEARHSYHGASVIRIEIPHFYNNKIRRAKRRRHGAPPSPRPEMTVFTGFSRFHSPSRDIYQAACAPPRFFNVLPPNFACHELAFRHARLASLRGHYEKCLPPGHDAGHGMPPIFQTQLFSRL